MKKITLLIFLTLLTTTAFSAVWQRRVINYNRNDYQAGVQNWMITQSDNQWLYIANNNGLLEFDGVYWNVYPVKDKIVRSVNISGDKIYVGGSSEFGYFRHDAKGILHYTSLSEREDDWAGEVWHIHENNGYIYFLDDYYIQIFKDDRPVKRITHFGKMDYSSRYGNHIYISTEQGIYVLNENHELEYIDSSSFLSGSKIIAFLPYLGHLLVVTATGGIFTWNRDSFSKLETNAEEFIRTSQLFCAALSGSRLALGSVQNGVCLLDLEQPEVYETFNLTKGLKNNTVLYTYFDHQGSLWLGLDKGLAYIDLNVPLLPLFSNESLIGTGYCSAMYQNELYLGTNQGVFKAEKDGQFNLVPHSNGQNWSMLLYDESLFCAGDNGITVITPPKETYKIPLRGIWEVQPYSSDPDTLVGGCYSGLMILKKEK
ncbi:MAG: hypothetical protein LIP05_00720, partial [Tannerellaceae bacterium]|nr:hypothetical protein [Tannerellaceae bacterium]